MTDNYEFEFDKLLKEIEGAAIAFAYAVENRENQKITREMFEGAYRRLRTARQNLLDLFRKVRDA